MPVESSNLQAACQEYALTLQAIAGSPPVLDLIHLGLGPDGHTASLVPGDAVLEIKDADVAITGLYQGRQRMTLTYPIPHRSRRVLWLVTGSEKAGMLPRLLAGDAQIPAGRVRAGITPWYWRIEPQPGDWITLRKRKWLVWSAKAIKGDTSPNSSASQ